MNSRVREQDESLLSRLLDGDLPAEEASALRERMQREPALRAAFEALARVDGLLADRRADQPSVDYGRFQAQVMAQLSAEMANPRVEEADEFALSRLLDGDLPADEAAAVQARLGSDAGLRDRLDSLARVDQLLAGRRADQPDVDYGRFRRQVMRQVANEPAPGERLIRFPAWLRVMAPLAAAAAIALFVLLKPQAGLVPGGGQVPRPGDVASTHGPTDQAPAVPDKTSPDQPQVVVAIADRTPARSTAPIVVQVNRPGSPARDPRARVQVDYARSDELATTIRQDDERRRSQPSRTLFFAMGSQPPASPPLVIDAEMLEAGFLEAAPL